MKKPFSTVVVAIGLSVVCTIAPAMSPAMSPAWADNAVSTTATDFVTASDGDCANGATVDDAAAAQARQRVEAVGYTDVQILNKSCDNSWRATGIKGGETRNLVVTPDGGVLPGGN